MEITKAIMKKATGLLHFFNKMRFRKCVTKPPYNHIVQLGDPVLRIACKEVNRNELKSTEFKELLGKMRKVIKRYKCVGVSAPQLGVDMQVFAMAFPDVDDFHGTLQEYQLKKMQPYPYSVWINPSLKVLDYSKVKFSEGCESMRGFSAEVSRYNKVKLTGWDENGHEKSEELSGWLARVAQHEMDHLHGRLFLDLTNMKSLSCTFWDRVNSTGGRIYMSYYPNKIFSKS